LAIGGIAPLLLLVALAFVLPESPRYRVLRKRQPQKVAALLQRIDGENYDNAWFYLPEQPATTGSVMALFQRGVLPVTLLLWCVFFMSLMIVYLLSSWLPTLLNNSGIDLQHASWVTAMFQVGGTLGAIVVGQLMDRHNPYRVLMISYGVGALFILLIGFSEGSLWSMAFMVLGTGIGISGSQVGLNALSAMLYPTGCRATGVSWANAIGRCGAILGSLSGAVMLSFNLSFPTIFMLIAIPALIAVLALGLLFAQVRGGQQPVPVRG
jgi:AAHS family 4-hydroxybenzoate transporter-like MFS transporter